MKKPYKVHIGYTAKGNSRWAKFSDLSGASAFCESVRKRRNVILSIVR